MNKGVEQVYSGMLFRHKQNKIMPCVVDGPRDGHTQWSKSEREKKHCIIVLIWNLGEGNGTPLQYSCLENPMDGGAWWAAVHGVAEGQTWLSAFTFTFHFHALEKEMAPHSSVLAWRIPGTGEPGGLPSMGLHRVRHDWSNLAAAAGKWYRWLYLKSRNRDIDEENKLMDTERGRGRGMNWEIKTVCHNLTAVYCKIDH